MLVIGAGARGCQSRVWRRALSTSRPLPTTPTLRGVALRASGWTPAWCGPSSPLGCSAAAQPPCGSSPAWVLARGGSNVRAALAHGSPRDPLCERGCTEGGGAAACSQHSRPRASRPWPCTCVPTCACVCMCVHRGTRVPCVFVCTGVAVYFVGGVHLCARVWSGGLVVGGSLSSAALGKPVLTPSHPRVAPPPPLV